MARKISVQIVGDSASLERSFKRSTAAASKFNSDLSHVGRGVLAVGVGYRSLARSVAFASGAFVGAAGITAAMKSSLSGFSQFNEAMQKTVGLANVAQGSVAGFSKQILQLAPEVGKSPQELANAFLFAASSGLKAAEAMRVVAVSAKASAAGLGETQVVADAVTSAMNAYGPSVLSAQKATDVLVATVREGKGEADQFAGVIGNVAALASQLGVSFDQVGAALAAETRLGVDAETAATQLQRVFSSLIKVTPQQAKAFKSVGLNADTLRDQLGKKGLLFVLDEVKKAFAGNLPALAKAFGDVRAVRGVLALVGNQAQATEAIFKRMANTAGSLKTAFDAVSNDSAQQFRKLRAAAEVAGISIGAIFAPLAGKVADALAGAANEFTSFLNRVDAQSTIRGKLNVVWEGAEGAARGAESALAAAVGKIDWGRVWAGARGIADGLQARLEAVDWGKIGKGIGDGIASAVSAAVPAAKQLAVKIGDVVGAIDWVKLGKKAGPGLASAVVTAFTTLLDPGFWLKNWDLALAVGLTVFGGSVGKIAGKLGAVLVKPFARIGADAALALSESLERAAPAIGRAAFREITAIADSFEKVGGRLAGPIVRELDKAARAARAAASHLGEEVLSGLLAIPRLAGRALGGLVAPIKAVFDRLGGLAKFTVKVLGIKVAIDTVAAFVANVAHQIGHGLDSAWEAMKRKAIKTALDVVEPFSHLPKFLGGWARDAKNALQAQLDGMVKASQDAGDAITRALTNSAQPSPKTKPAGSISRSAGFGGNGSDVAPIPKAAAQRLKDTVSSATAAASTAATTAVEKGFVLPFRLQLAQAKAAATKATGDDLAAAKQVRAFILKAIPHLHGQKLLDAYQQLGQVTGQLADSVKAAAAKVKGFAVPLALQVAQARAEAFGKDDQLRKVLDKIKAAATTALKAGKLGLQGQLDALNAIISVNSQLADAGKKTAAAFKKASTKQLVAGLGLSADEVRALRARLSQVGPNGTVPRQGVGAFGAIIGRGGDIVVHTSVNLDGKKVGQSVTRHQQKRNQRNPPQRRGPHAGLAF